MMRIDGPASLLQALQSALPMRKPEVAHFPAPPAPVPAANVSAQATPVQSVAMLVALASTSQVDAERRREDMRHAEQGVEALALLHSGLVAGVLSPQRVRALREWAKHKRRPEDPELASLTDEVELRILVELAKLDR